MFHRSILNLLFSNRLQKSRRRQTRPSHRRAAVGLETLETRCVLSAGSLDTTFGGGDGWFSQNLPEGIAAPSHLRTAAGQQSDGTIVIAGSTAGSDRNVFVARLDANGSFLGHSILDLDTGGTGVVTLDTVFDLAIDSQDRIVVVGQTERITAPTIVPRLFAARFLPNGAPDTTFGADGPDPDTDPDGFVTLNLGGLSAAGYSVAVDGSERIVVAGRNFGIGNDNVLITRFDSFGTLDTTFDTDGVVTTDLGAFNDAARDVAIDSAGRIVVTGTGQTIAGHQRAFVARYLSNGSPDNDFAPVTADLKTGVDNVALISPILFANSSSDSIFSSSLVLQPIGGSERIVIAGTLQKGTTGQFDFALARLHANGDLDNDLDTDPDTVFGTNGTQVVDILARDLIASDPLGSGPSLALQPDNTLLVGSGVTATPSSPHQFGLARLLSDGTLDCDFTDGAPMVGCDGKVQTTFTSTSDQWITNLLIQADGRIVASGVVDLNLTGTDSFEIAVARYESGLVPNTPPTITVTAATVTAGEGSTATNGGTYADAESGVTLSASIGTVTDLGGGQWSWLLPVGDGPMPTQTVTITAEDDGGLEDFVEFDLVVDNLDPTADAGGPYSVAPGQTIQLDASGSSDPAGAADPLTFAWDFDEDGQFDDATGPDPDFDPAAFGIVPGQTANIAVQVDDGDGGADTATTTVVVAGEGISLTGGTLFAIGSAGGDSVTIQLVGGQLVIESGLIPGGSLSLNPADVDAIVVQGGAGNDMVVISNDVTIDVELDAGDGNDLIMTGGGNDLVKGGTGNDLILTQSGDDVLLAGAGTDFLYGGFGNDVLIAGDGDDQLFGGGGFDLLIGGSGPDWLWGGEGQDILIGGTTSYDSYDPAGAAAIDQVMQIWTGTGTYDQRVAQLTSSGGLLQAYDGQTGSVFNDDDSDIYIGGGALDVYFADGSDDILLFASVLEEVVELGN